ncbi:MAG: 7-cyano-7-deazaguanine synthase QueC [Vampirovibrionales bacterium]|nr:7-cyano-7-deazaguanine synthase QueC [Vampirovibrionales bacterium]
MLQPLPTDAQTQSAVALLSGGLDSVVAMADALHNLPGCIKLALTFNYGQRAFAQELAASRAIAQHYGVVHQVIELPWLAQQVPSLMSAQRAHGEKLQSATAKAVWIPNRNGVFLNIAASFAEALGAQAVIFGANAEEAEAGFPDNSEMYRVRLNTALDLSTLNHVRVIAPVGHLNKPQIGERAVALGVPLELIWSCYDALETHCGQCPSCVLLQKALVSPTRQGRVNFMHHANPC